MTQPAPQTTSFWKIVGGFVAVVAVLGVLVSCADNDHVVSTPATGGQETSAPTVSVQATATTPTPADDQIMSPPITGDAREVRGRFTAAEGYIPDGEWVSVFATDLPAVGNLAPDLLEAVQRAWSGAAHDGVDLFITSGWRSERYQQGLLDDAIVTYGSVAEARKWVNTPEQSSHVTGNAVDIGPTDAAYWLSQHGYEYGLCQTYANEIWHYELATEPGGTCPAPITDASAADVAENDTP